MTTQTEDKTTANWLKEAQKGYIRMGVLILLNKKPSHGYEIMKEINSRTKGFWQPTAGGVYPILRDLEKSGYIKGHWETQKNRRLKVYKITESGEQILRKAIFKQTEIFNNIGALFREFSRDVLNVEATDGSMPSIPSPFSPFLEEKVGANRSLKQLENERKHIFETVKTMRDRVKLLDKRIAEIKKEAKPDSSPTSTL
ncbi:MAG: PadR family transcriptional regulator [Candidatus Bathyarchaeota archaeon]|nr:PadR family transcriptional regulator [Candidatus Bathyarchaeota archaeon]